MTLLAEQQKQIERKVTKIYGVLPKLLNERMALYTGFDKYMEEDIKKNRHQVMV